MPLSKKNQTAAKASMPLQGFAAELLGASPLPMAVFATADASNIWANQSWVMLFQYGPQTGSSVIGESIGKVLQTQTPVTLHEIEIDGQRCHQVMVFPCNEKGDVAAIVVPATQNHRFDAADQARNALRPAGLMARMLAHEIRNPLAGIQASGQLLLKKMGLQDSDRRLAELVVSESQRIGRLVDKMAVFDDNMPAIMSSVNLHSPLEHAIDSATAVFPTLKILRRFDPSLPDIQANHDHLVQVFMNLLKNATEAGADNVKITTAYHLGATVIHPRSMQKLPLRTTIEDNGEGMSEETRKRLFEAYYTTKATGQGFGLAIAAKIIDDHGGIIEVIESKTGKTVIDIYLPLCHESMQDT